MAESDVDTVNVMMDECCLLTDSDYESSESMDWTFLGGSCDDTSSLDCVSEDDFLLVSNYSDHSALPHPLLPGLLQFQ